jgi:hypothetical protein
MKRAYRSLNPARPARKGRVAGRRNARTPGNRRQTPRCVLTGRALGRRTCVAIKGVGNAVCYALWGPLQKVLKRLPELQRTPGALTIARSPTYVCGTLRLTTLVVSCPAMVVSAFIEACHPSRQERLYAHIALMQHHLSTMGTAARAKDELGHPVDPDLLALVRGLPKAQAFYKLAFAWG